MGWFGSGRFVYNMLHLIVVGTKCSLVIYCTQSLFLIILEPHFFGNLICDISLSKVHNYKIFNLNTF